MTSPLPKSPPASLVGNRVVSRGPPPLPSAAPAGAPSSVVVRAAPSSPADDPAAVHQAISASVAPLLRKQQELEARIEREAAERQRLREEVERLRQMTNSRAAPRISDPPPEMLDAARRGRKVLLMIMVIVAMALTSTLGAMLLSQTR